MMSKKKTPTFRRTMGRTLSERLAEERRFIQVLAGPRQVGKTTLVQQVLADLPIPSVYVSADEPTLRDSAWLKAQWDRARLTAQKGSRTILAVDEIQKCPGWEETVKRLWDEDTADGRNVRVVVLGSAPLLVQKGLSESLAGRFEVTRFPHWSLDEMGSAFGFNLGQYLFFGGYPGAAPLANDLDRWRRYILDSLVETTLARDVLLMTRVDKPALLRRLFDLGCRYSGQVLSYNKMLGQLQDAGNTTTLAHYLDLLSGAGMLRGLQKFAGQAVRRRASSPKLQVLNTGLLTAASGLSPESVAADPEFNGRLTESAIGAHLANAEATGVCEVFYWRDGNREVDFVLRRADTVVAIEVKSGGRPTSLPGLAAFTDAFSPTRALLVGGDGIPVEEFLLTPVGHWLGD